MGLSWQQGPLSAASVGRFLTDVELPARLLFAEPLLRRMRVQFNSQWIADSEDVVLLHEPGYQPVAFFPMDDVEDGALERTERTTEHHELGPTSWFTVSVDGVRAQRAAWQYTDVPDFAELLKERVAFVWRAMDGFYEEDERILGHASDMYHRLDTRSTSRHLVVMRDGEVIADTHAPIALYESGFAPRFYVDRKDVNLDRLTPMDGQTFCPYKGLSSYYSVDGIGSACWSYERAFAEVQRIDKMLSFDLELLDIYIDGELQRVPKGQVVIGRGFDRGVNAEEAYEHQNPV